MGIKFACSQCGHVLNVKAELAGKRGVCPKCQAKVMIPALEAPVGVAAPVATAVPASSLPAAAQPVRVVPAAPRPAEPVVDPIAENPKALWYVVPSGMSTPYGPAPAEMFREWIVEGRVTPDALVWRQDWTDWRRADEVLPQFKASAANATDLFAGLAEAMPAPPASLDAPGDLSPLAINTGERSRQPSVLQSTSAAPPKKYRVSVLIALLIVAIVVLLPVMLWVVTRG
jgi:hypothetical protein